MKNIMIVLGFLSLVGCGYSSKENEMTGQVKKVIRNTPLICNDFNSVDISLGVMRNGTGSMSTQDVWLYVPNEEDFKNLKEAAASGVLVKITYDDARLRFCVNEKVVTKVEPAL